MIDTVPVTFVSSHSQLGGSERYLSLLFEGLGAQWIEDVVALEDGPFLRQVEAQLHHRPHVITTGRRAGSIIRSAWRLRRRFRSTGGRPHVVHANGVKAALVCGLATWGTRIPVVWVKHDFSWDGRLGRFIAARCRLVVGVSAAVVEDLRLPSNRSRVVHTGVAVVELDRDEARSHVESILGRGPIKSVALLVGRLHPAKGQIELIESIPEVLTRIPQGIFVLLGGEDRTTLDYAERVKQRVETLGLQESVIFLDHRADADLFIAGADILLVPSVRDERGMGREGFSLVALEAMSAGTPVVAYADGALPEVMGSCARFVPPGDRSALSLAISELLIDEGMRTSLARCGKERADGEFSLHVMIDSMKACYRQAAGAREAG